MELLAVFAVAFATLVGWVICATCLARTIPAAERIYFAPAIGATVCGVVGYLAVVLHVASLLRPLGIIGLAGAGWYCWRMRSVAVPPPHEPRVAVFTFGVVLLVYGMQIALYGLFSRVHPGPHEVWSLFNLTGTPPPDQMFAWHQAMFIAKHRHYPIDAFYGEMDFYDRPHLGGWITLFFFKLLHLPLHQHALEYPAAALRFYHRLWWLLNNLYLAAVAPLFRRIFGVRAAVFAVASTALGGFFLLCNVGAWMKFSSAYPFLLAFLLFLRGEGPLLQALLCAASYYIHGSALPFLAGFGALQIISTYSGVFSRRTQIRAVAMFAGAGILLVGAWFVTVRYVGSRQPLFYYYVYDAGLTEAQTRSVSEIAHDFYSRHSWSEVSLQPLVNLAKSFWPVTLNDFSRAFFWLNAPARLPDVASTIFDSQRFCIECALAILAAPVVVIGAIRILAVKGAGKIAFCLYLLPTVLIALTYRKDSAFSLHIIPLYQAFALFCWVLMFRRASLRALLLGLCAIGFEGVVCVLFAERRFLIAKGIQLSELTAAEWPWLIAYASLFFGLIAAAAFELARLRDSLDEGCLSSAPATLACTIALTSGKLLGAAIAVGIVVAVYALYCRRFY